ncbi:MAG TPA: methionine--tRNA ligase [Candidatus Limnocylindrales bacterium]|jgi:methionyl-tRNA synthetase|nr:methionine--tRNA ligase [Candidatus Limnocylindrales bacterium]
MPDQPDRPRFYLTTAIAYPNNRPGLHTLYEVIGADVIARWHRMLGHDTRFLTGTDEHSVNIAQRAAELGLEPGQFADEMVALFQEAEGALLIAPDRFIRTTDPDHRRASQEMVRRAYASGDVYLGTYEGWYCPNEGFKAPSDLLDTTAGMRCPNHPDVELQWLTERNWFFRLSAYRDRLLAQYEAHPEWVEPEYRRNEMLAFLRGGLDDISISRETFHWGIPFPIAENGETAEREDGSWDPEAGVIYVWFDALINYITGAGFPDDPEAFAKWWPADLHVIGKDINRFHTIIWPAMLMSAGIELPRKVWVHGFMTVQGEKMSKSRGNFLEPKDVVAAFGADGARFVTLREVPFDRDADVSWDSFVRRYNADLANDFGNLVNRTVSMANRYLAGERPPSRAAGDSPLAGAWADAIRAYGQSLDAYLLHEALAGLWEFVGAANRLVDAEKPWDLAKAAKAGDDEAARHLRGVLGDLVEAARLIGLAAAPFLPSAAPRVLAQLGYEYPYGADGNAGPPILDELRWGAHASESGRLGAAEPLFPRLETEPAET